MNLNTDKVTNLQIPWIEVPVAVEPVLDTAEIKLKSKYPYLLEQTLLYLWKNWER